METAFIQNAARSAENAHELALRLRTRRLEFLAANIANADTPNYKARDIDFGAELERAMASGNAFVGMATTSGGIWSPVRQRRRRHCSTGCRCSPASMAIRSRCDGRRARGICGECGAYAVFHSEDGG